MLNGIFGWFLEDNCLHLFHYGFRYLLRRMDVVGVEYVTLPHFYETIDFFFFIKKIKSSLQLVEIVGLGCRGISWLDRL